MVAYLLWLSLYLSHLGNFYVEIFMGAAFLLYIEGTTEVSVLFPPPLPWALNMEMPLQMYYMG